MVLSSHTDMGKYTIENVLYTQQKQKQCGVTDGEFLRTQTLNHLCSNCMMAYKSACKHKGLLKLQNPPSASAMHITHSHISSEDLKKWLRNHTCFCDCLLSQVLRGRSFEKRACDSRSDFFPCSLCSEYIL